MAYRRDLGLARGIFTMELNTGLPTEIGRVMQLDRLLTLKDLTRATSLSRTTIYRMVNEGTLPAPIKIGKSRIAWRASSIARWLAERQVAA